MDVDTVMRAHWSPPAEGERIESITQMRGYVILITSYGRVWKAQDEAGYSDGRPLFSLVAQMR